MSSLVLGTAQLGLPYGIANATGQPDLRTAVKIVRAAWEGGIREFDTAQEYGKSEEVLGQAFRELEITNKVRVISKLAKDIDLKDGKAVIHAVKSSLTRLGVSKLFGLLLHKEELLDIWQEKIIGSPLHKFVQHLGVSVYSPGRARQALASKAIDIVQIPSNILERRFEEMGGLQKVKRSSKIVYVRSAFLQGLLLMTPDEVPSHMEFARPVVERVHTLAKDFCCSNLALALGYLKAVFPFAHVIVGAETPKQVSEIIAAWNDEVPSAIIDRVRTTFSIIDPRILDPRLWPKRIS